MRENRIKGQFTIESFNIENTWIVSVQKNTANLIVTQLSDKTSRVIELELDEILDENLSICQIPDFKVFCYGNSYESKGMLGRLKRNFSGLTFIADQNNYNLEILDSWVPCTSSSSIYYNDKVYVFGGNNQKPLPLAGKFHLGRKK